MPLGPQLVPYGNVQSAWLLSLTLTPVAVAATTAAQQTFTINGLLLGDYISALQYSGALTSQVTDVNAWVSANNTLAVTFSNTTAGSLTPPSGTYSFLVIRAPVLTMSTIQ